MPPVIWYSAGSVLNSAAAGLWAALSEPLPAVAFGLAALGMAAAAAGSIYRRL